MFTGGLVAGLEATRSAQGQQVDPVTFLPPAMLSLIFLAALAAPQFSINALLAREKREELAALREESHRLSTLPEGAGPEEGTRRVLRQQAVLFEMRSVETFKPLVVNGRFILQIGLSIAGVLVANVVIPLALEQLLG
jgi:hypothetical protein